jgi:hypothetical protein
MADDFQVKVSFPELEQLRAKLRELPPNLQRKYLGAAIRKSLGPGLAALKTTTPKGPTGNLRRAIASKVKTYRSGNAAGLVGYVAAGSGKSVSAAGGAVRKGKDRAFHAGLVEFGTKDRATKGPIASSYRKLGPFKLKKPTRKQAAAGFAPVRTTPAYPRAFFKRAPRGFSVALGQMPAGGASGAPPVKTAYQRSLGAMRALLPANMATAIENAIKDMRWREYQGMNQ